MKQSFSFLALGAVVLLGASLAPAQDATVSARVSVPFAFRVGSAVLPAGQYDVQLDGAEMPGVLQVRSSYGQRSAFVLANHADVPRGVKQARLIFNKDGDDFVLTEFVDPGADRAIRVAGTHPAAEGRRAEAATE
jgi:hypothetical protein